MNIYYFYLKCHGKLQDTIYQETNLGHSLREG